MQIHSRLNGYGNLSLPLMREQIPSKNIWAHKWLSLADNVKIQKQLKDDSYSIAYISLMSHFSRHVMNSWDDAVVGLHIVYGWMPTIPRLAKITTWDESQKTSLVAALKKAKKGTPHDEEIELIRSFCNNSMVGASKLLHFLNPDVFPIWDSRVAKAFFNRPRVYPYQLNRIESYKLYQSTLTSWLADYRVIQKCQNMRGLGTQFAHVSNLRLVELVLFHKIGSNRKNGKK